MFFKNASLIKVLASLIFITGISFSAISHASLVVIVHPDNPISSLPNASIRKIFLRKVKSFPDGSSSKPAELELGETREEFNASILKKTESSLSSYWARMLFSGKSRPPKQFNNPEELKSYVASHPDAIGYIDSSFADSSVKIVNVQ